MSSASAFTRGDLQILLRIIGSRKGADLGEIMAFHKSHRWPEATPEQIRDVITRFVSLGWVTEQGEKFLASPTLQSAFNEACRNCRDTIEEFDILARILEPNTVAVKDDQ
jgi:hypothetical protein